MRAWGMSCDSASELEVTALEKYRCNDAMAVRSLDRTAASAAVLDRVTLEGFASRDSSST